MIENATAASIPSHDEAPFPVTGGPPRRQLRTPAASLDWTHAFTIQTGHPLAAVYAPGVVLMLAPCAPSEPLAPGRYLDACGRVRACIAGADGAPFLAGVGAPASAADAEPVARIVGAQWSECEPEVASSVVPFARRVSSRAY